ncbi:MAG TPA: helix-turn-helix transcriptional regulator [Luteolibacter sp.]
MKNRLKLLRAERNWTQDELGKRVGVSRQAINALETEKHDPSLDLAYRLSVEFGLPVERIFENPHGGPGNAPET